MEIPVALLLIISCAFAAPSDYGNRIVGGRPASRGQFPHQISLRVNNQHICGGSIILQNKILTAAHCVYGMNMPMTVVVGETKLNVAGQTHAVTQAVYHQDFDPRSLVNDVAVLTLSSYIQYNQNVAAISMRNDDVIPSEVLTLSGWGQTSEPGQAPNDLQYMSMRAIDLQTCANELVGRNPITNGQVCTSSPPGEGACMGDSGGPLIDAQGKQIGVVSWGVPCARGAPDVFTSVPFYSLWIWLQ